MPDLFAILTLYQMRTAATLSGALRDEAALATAGARLIVASGFLSRRERADWDDLTPEARAARLRVGAKRFQRWERMNPDIAALLQRRAGEAAVG